MNCPFNRSERSFPTAWRIVIRLLVCLCFSGTQGPAQAATLQQLFDGGFINVGSTRFSDWELVSLDDTDDLPPFFSQIFVNANASDPSRPGLNYTNNGHLATLGINAIDLTFKFRVQALYGGKAYVDQRLDLTGISIGADTGLAYLSQDLVDSSGNDLGATVVMADAGSGFFQLADVAVLPHRYSMTVTTNVFLTGLSGADSVSLSAFTQRFTQTGPQSPPGDFDVDGDVDGNDFLKWQRGESPVPFSSTDLADWQANYGTGGSPLTAAVQGVPEPHSLVLMCLAGAFPNRRRRT